MQLVYLLLFHYVLNKKTYVHELKFTTYRGEPNFICIYSKFIGKAMIPFLGFIPQLSSVSPFT